MLTFLARFLAAVCAIVFVPVTVLVIFLDAAGTRLIHAPIYRDALVSEKFYARYPALTGEVVRTVGSNTDDTKLAKLLHALTPDDCATLLGAVIPPTYLQQQVEGSLDQCFAYLHSDTAASAGRISLAELKRRLRSPDVVAAYAKVLAAKPPGTDAQVAEADGLPFDCQPPKDKLPQVLEHFGQTMRSLADQMPDDFEIYHDAGQGGSTGATATTIAQARHRVRQFETIVSWSTAVPLVLLVLIALLAVRSLRGGLFWWGVPCLLAGAIAAGFAGLTVPTVQWISTNLVAPALPPGTSPAILQALLDFMTAVVQQVMTAAWHNGGVLALVGLGAVILGFILKPKAPAPNAFRTA